MAGSQRKRLILMLSAAVIGSGFLPPQTSAAGESGAPSGPRILYADSLLIMAPVPLQARLTVQSSDTLVPVRRTHIYKYSVTNERSARVGVCRFALAPVAVPDSVIVPPGWTASFEQDEEGGTVVWAVADTLTPPPGWEESAAWPNPFEIQPGQTKVFGLFCRRPPGPLVSFHAQVFDTVSNIYPDDGPNRDGADALPATGVRGGAVGPAGAGAEGGEANAEQAGSPPEPPPPHGPPSMATISFFLPRRAEVRLSVHDSRGRPVKGLIQGSLAGGFHSMTWNGTDSKGIAAAGGYSFRLFVDGMRAGQRRVALRHGP